MKLLRIDKDRGTNSCYAATAITQQYRLVRCLVLALGLALSAIADAGAPQLGTQAPGYYRMMLGDMEVTALSDGTLALPVDRLLTNATPAEIESALAHAYLGAPLETSVNCYLINTGAKLVLIDAGTSLYFGPTLGHLVANLKSSGYQPEQIDEIYLTHMHLDHVGGLTSDGKLAFPNATVRADQREVDYWSAQAQKDAASKTARGATASLQPYIAAGRFKPFLGDTELVPGVRALSRFGHTAGHTIYMVESKGQRLALLGDVIHVAAVQFKNPTVSTLLDTDSTAATRQRQQAFAEAAEQGYWVAAAHLAFPGIGHLRASAGGYIWVPANYSSLR